MSPQLAADIFHLAIRSVAAPDFLLFDAREMNCSWLARLVLLAMLIVSGPAAAQLRYFGYVFGVSPIPGIAVDANAVERTAPYTNFVAFGTTLTDPGFVAQVQALAASRQLAIVNVAPVLWDFSRSPAPLLFDDWPSRWEEWASANASVLNSSNLLALRVFDEPFHLGIDMQGYEAVCARIKQTFPWVKVLLVEGTSTSAFLNSSNYHSGGGRLPNVDWLAVDAYSIHPASDPTFRDWLGTLKGYFPGRSWFYALDGFWDADHTAAFGYDLTVMAAIADEWYGVAAEDPDAVGLGVFLWQAEDQRWTVSRDFPQAVLDEHRRIGESIVSSSNLDDLVHNPSFETREVP